MRAKAAKTRNENVKYVWCWADDDEALPSHDSSVPLERMCVYELVDPFRLSIGQVSEKTVFVKWKRSLASSLTKTIKDTCKRKQMIIDVHQPWYPCTNSLFLGFSSLLPSFSFLTLCSSFLRCGVSGWVLLSRCWLRNARRSRWWRTRKNRLSYRATVSCRWQLRPAKHFRFDSLHVF